MKTPRIPVSPTPKRCLFVFKIKSIWGQNLLCVLSHLFQELFVGQLAKDSYIHTVQGKRKTVQRKDMGTILVLMK